MKELTLTSLQKEALPGIMFLISQKPKIGKTFLTAYAYLLMAKQNPDCLINVHLGSELNKLMRKIAYIYKYSDEFTFNLEICYEYHWIKNDNIKQIAKFDQPNLLAKHSELHRQVYWLRRNGKIIPVSMRREHYKQAEQIIAMGHRHESHLE